MKIYNKTFPQAKPGYVAQEARFLKIAADHGLSPKFVGTDNKSYIDMEDLDELNVTDNLDKLSVHLQREIVLNRYVYKIILGFSMMSAKSIIMGADYPAGKMLEIEKRGLRTAYGLIM